MRGPYVWTFYPEGTRVWYLQRADCQPLPDGEWIIEVAPERVPSDIWVQGL